MRSDASHGAADEWVDRVGRLFWNFSWHANRVERYCVELSEQGDASNGCCHSTRHMQRYVSARPLWWYFFIFSFQFLFWFYCAFLLCFYYLLFILLFIYFYLFIFIYLFILYFCISVFLYLDLFYFYFRLPLPPFSVIQRPQSITITTHAMPWPPLAAPRLRLRVSFPRFPSNQYKRGGN